MSNILDTLTVLQTNVNAKQLILTKKETELSIAKQVIAPHEQAVGLARKELDACNKEVENYKKNLKDQLCTNGGLKLILNTMAVRNENSITLKYNVYSQEASNWEVYQISRRMGGLGNRLPVVTKPYSHPLEDLICQYPVYYPSWFASMYCKFTPLKYDDEYMQHMGEYSILNSDEIEQTYVIDSTHESYNIIKGSSEHNFKIEVTRKKGFGGRGGQTIGYMMIITIV
jgi:hypothetical protein